MLCGGAYNGAKYYVYRLIARDGAVAVRFRDLRLSLFPLGLQIRNLRDFPIRDDNLVSFAAVNVYLPTTSLFMKKKAISIEIEKPLFVLDDALLKGGNHPGGRGLGSSFAIHRVRLRQGELHFQGRDFQARLLAFNLQSGSLAEGFSFRLDSPHLRVTLPISGEEVSLEGNLTTEVHQEGETWRLRRFSWQTPKLRFDANGRLQPGRVFQINVSAQGSPEDLLRPILEEMTVQGLTYADARILRDSQGIVRISADFNSPSCLVQTNRCANLRGAAHWDSRERALQLEAVFDSELARSRLLLASRRRDARITLQDIPAAALVGVLDIRDDAPLSGIIRRGEVEFVPGLIRGQAELDATPERPLSHPFVAVGRIEFQRDKKAKRTTFSGEKLLTGAGEISIRGATDSLAHTVDVRVDAALRGLEAVAPYAAHYLDLDLRPWNLSGGSGDFELRVERRGGRKLIDSRFRVDRFQANRQAIAGLRGEVRHAPPATRGLFTITAPDLESRAELEIVPGQTAIRFPDLRGEAAKILGILGLEVDLQGRVAGDITYRGGRALPEPEVQGTIRSAKLRFLGLAFEGVQSALGSNLQGISLSGLEFLHRGGRGRGDVRVDFGRRAFEIHGAIAGIDVSRLLGGLAGRADLEIDGRGEFMKEPLTVAYRLHDLSYYADRVFQAQGTASLVTDFSDFRLSTQGDVIDPLGSFPFRLELGRSQGRWDGSFEFDLRDLDLLIPWRNNEGSMRLLGQFFTAPDGGIGSRGVAVFAGRTLSLPNFSHTLDDFQATVTFAGGRFAMQSLRGRMGGGPVEGNGQLRLEDGRLQGLVINLQGRDLRLYPMDRAACLVTPNLTLRYENGQLLLSGSLAFASIDWHREIDERIVFSTRSQLSTAESRILEALRLDIAMDGENVRMHNSLGRIHGRLKLRLSGTATFPILSGVCEGSQGEIHFSDRSFNLLKAKLVFNNPALIDPLIHIESEAFIQSYRIRFDIRGSASRAKPELSSSPPLPTPDILALVSLGEVFQRSGSLEISSRESGAALVTTKLTEEIKNRANKLLGIDVLRIDPVFSGQSTLDTSRLTIGKSISKDLVVVYSTTLSTSRQEILYLQYQLSPSISLIAMRNQEGRYSLDLRLRSRR